MEETLDFAERGWRLVLVLGEKFATWIATSGVRILIIGVLAWIALIVARRLIGRFHELIAGRDAPPDRVKRADTLAGILRTIAFVVVLVVSFMMIMQEVGVAIGPIIAAAGLGGIAIGFGAQSLVKDVISGFFVLAEEQIRVGDVVQVAGKGGLVESIGIRTIRLRDLAGSVHIVPHGNVDVVTNMTKDFACYVFDVGVAYREDPDEVIEALRKLGEEMQNDPTFGPDILEPLEIFGVDMFGESAVVVKARFKTKPIRQWAVGREFNRRLKKRFDELGIEIPFPHVTLYAGQTKKGETPPVPIELRNHSSPQ